jgi:hypothetical protein
LAHGRKLLTLQDAATYITNLPKKESDLPEWQAAIEALMLVADRGGPTMFARIGVPDVFELWWPSVFTSVSAFTKVFDTGKAPQ